jgi:predicted dehydrogenase/threonine dehydrogenase-like Zn-dependent dehydrogenase
MLQLTQKLKNGKMTIIDTPFPKLRAGNIMVKNHFSFISAGTESSTVRAARKGYFGKAKERPQQVKQVIETLKTQGHVQTYRAVMKKLDAFSPLGYSCAGEVIEIHDSVSGYRCGDLVACGGLTASHAEVVSVPSSLCVKLNQDADLKQAVYNTLGAIALQGVRQADLKLGETCCVIGLGILGQLTALLLNASGVRAVGVDIDPAMVDFAGRHCLESAFHRNDAGIDDKIRNFTNGHGCDAIIITAASESLDPINFAGAISRKKGTVVVVGAVPTGFDREPHFYQKELQIKMSCSYGPGRYDPNYEEKGIDYPFAYVRWTEKRNMAAFQELIYRKKIDVSYLTTHTFKLTDAPQAYEMMMSKSEPYVGILIEYDVSRDTKREKVVIQPQNGSKDLQKVVIGFIGAGSYAQNHLLPNIPKKDNILLKGAMTASSTGARSVSERFGFEFCTGDEADILGDNEINTVFIATRHDSHAEYVIKAIQSGKHVFVEKPLCLTEQELAEIDEVYKTKIRTGQSVQIVLVGYNRRFSPLAQTVKQQVGGGSMAMLYRINAGYIPKESWIQDTQYGGGRIIGEVCHFIDFLTYINGSLPTSVYACDMIQADNANDVLNVSLTYENGSIGTICYFSNGDKRLPKERVEIFSHGCTAVIDDFRSLSIFSQGKRRSKKLLNQNKGQKNEVNQFIEAVVAGRNEVISIEEIMNTSRVTFKIIESLQKRECIKI